MKFKAGSFRAIVYVFFQMVDELFHLFATVVERAEFELCQWAHRHDEEGH